VSVDVAQGLACFAALIGSCGKRVEGCVRDAREVCGCACERL
jgi:hypothetical protein